MSAQSQFSTHCSQGERLGRLIEEMQYSCLRLVFVVILWWVVWCFVTAMSEEGLGKVFDNINVREIFFSSQEPHSSDSVVCQCGCQH